MKSKIVILLLLGAFASPAWATFKPSTNTQSQDQNQSQTQSTTNTNTTGDSNASATVGDITSQGGEATSAAAALAGSFSNGGEVSGVTANGGAGGSSNTSVVTSADNNVTVNGAITYDIDFPESVQPVTSCGRAYDALNGVPKMYDDIKVIYTTEKYADVLNTMLKKSDYISSTNNRALRGANGVFKAHPTKFKSISEMSQEEVKRAPEGTKTIFVQIMTLCYAKNGALGAGGSRTNSSNVVELLTGTVSGAYVVPYADIKSHFVENEVTLNN